jgi:hypothetical protein
MVARRGAVITGSVGVGKTTLAMACLQAAQDRGMRVARTAATQASQELPFGALASCLPPDQGNDRLGCKDQTELLRRYSQAVVDAAGKRQLVMFIDDAHLLDDGSATLVHHLAQTRVATVIATVPSEEAPPAPVMALWQDGPAKRIEIGILDGEAIEELLVTVLGGPIDTYRCVNWSTAARTTRCSCGN